MDEEWGVGGREGKTQSVSRFNNEACHSMPVASVPVLWPWVPMQPHLKHLRTRAVCCAALCAVQVKGVRSMWRQSAPIVSEVLQVGGVGARVGLWVMGAVGVWGLRG